MIFLFLIPTFIPLNSYYLIISFNNCLKTENHNISNVGIYNEKL